MRKNKMSRNRKKRLTESEARAALTQLSGMTAAILGRLFGSMVIGVTLQKAPEVTGSAQLPGGTAAILKPGDEGYTEDQDLFTTVENG